MANYTSEQFLEVKKLHTEQQLGSRTIAKILNIPKGTISGWLYDGCLPKFLIIPEKMTANIAYLLGVLYGDGFMFSHVASKHYIIGLYVKDSDFISIFRELLNKEFGIKKRKIRTRLSKYKTHRIMFEYRIYSKQLTEYFQPFMNDISWLNDSSADIKTSFLRGFFDSEGCVYFNLKLRIWHVDITNTDLELLKMCESLLNNLNIKTCKIVIKKKASFKNKTVYSLFISNPFIPEFTNLIGSSIKRKNDKLNFLTNEILERRKNHVV